MYKMPVLLNLNLFDPVIALLHFLPPSQDFVSIHFFITQAGAFVIFVTDISLLKKFYDS